MATDLGPESEEHDPQEGTSDAGAHEVEGHEDYSEHDLDAETRTNDQCRGKPIGVSESGSKGGFRAAR